MADGDKKPHDTDAGFQVGPKDGGDTTGKRPLFCEMLELRPGQSVWRETARWVKFEENVEEDGNRWSKPFVASLSMHGILELRSSIANGSVMLDVQASTLNELWNALVADWIRLGLVPGSLHEALVATLMQPYKHQHQMGGRPGKGKKSGPSDGRTALKRSQSADDALEKGRGTPSVHSQYSQDSMDDADQPASERPNQRFFKKLPPGSEAATIMTAELEFLQRPLCGFIALKTPAFFRNLVEVATPSRYIFVALMPKGRPLRVTKEMGRTMGTLFSDELFQQDLYAVHSHDRLLSAVDNFMGCATVLPPGEWNPKIRIEPPTKVQSHESRMKEKRIREGQEEESDAIAHESHGSDIRRTGRICGGLIDDVKRKAKWYLSDFKDAMHIQSISSIIFLYFASMTPLITFGGLMSNLLHSRMGAMETILGRALSGVFWGFTAGQPLVILGSTGPILVFEVITFNLCGLMGIEYMNFRVWIGFWSTLFLLIMVVFDLSFLVGFITRFTEESFAALVSAIFVYEAIKKCLHIAEEEPIRTNPARNPDNFDECWCSVTGRGVFMFHDNFTKEACTALGKDENRTSNYTLVGPGCQNPHYVPDAFLLSVCLFFGTFLLARILKAVKLSPYFPTMVRTMISDFAVIISIAVFVLIDYLLGISTPKLYVPSKVEPTYAAREGSWFIPLFGVNEWWTYIAAAVPGMLATILIFMDQQITTVIVSRKENKLRHGIGYHLDLLIVAILIALLSWLGMPWMIADTVLSLTHSSSLRKESEVAAPGERPGFLGIREQRVTNIIISILIGVSVFLSKLLLMIPMPVLFGVFLFMGSNALMGLQFTDRIKLVFMPLKYQPDYVYLRHVKITRVHLFTLIQLMCLVTLWVLKSFQETAMLFPVMVGALVGVRKLLDYIFTQSELSFLDDLMPESTKRKNDDAKKKRKQEAKEPYFKTDERGVMRIPLANGNVLTVPVGGSSESSSPSPPYSSVSSPVHPWMNAYGGKLVSGDPEGKNGTPVGVRWTETNETIEDDPEKTRLLTTFKP